MRSPEAASWFVTGGADEPAPKTPEAGCALVVRNCNRHGECNARRPWCIVRRGIPRWLTQRFPGRWRQEPRPTYLFSRVDLLNPTHLAALHYLPLVRWLQAATVEPGQVRSLLRQHRLQQQSSSKHSVLQAALHDALTIGQAGRRC